MFFGQDLTGALLALMALSVGVILFMARMKRFGADKSKPRLTTLTFAFWMVGTVILTSYTFALRLPGLPDLSLERILFAALIGMAAFRMYRHDMVPAHNVVIEAVMVVFCVWCVISMANHGFVESYQAFPRPSFIFLSGYAIPFFTFFYAKRFLAENDDLIVLKIFFWFGTYLCLIAYMEHFGYRDSVIPNYIADTQLSTLHLDRARGPFLNSAFNGLAINIAFLCGVMTLRSTRPGLRTVQFLALVLYVPAIYFTRTRSVYVHFLFTLLVLLFIYRSRIARWKIIPVVLLFLGIALISNWNKLTSSDREAGGLGQVEEVAIRLELAEKSLNLLQEYPFSGVGLGQFRTGSLFTPEQAEMQHNHLIGMAVELGLPGAAMYIAILLLVFHRLYRLCGNVPEGDFANLNLVLLLATTLFVDMLNNFFVEPSLHMFTTVNFFFFAGMADGLYEKYCQGRQAFLPGE